MIDRIIDELLSAKNKVLDTINSYDIGDVVGLQKRVYVGIVLEKSTQDNSSCINGELLSITYIQYINCYSTIGRVKMKPTY